MDLPGHDSCIQGRTEPFTRVHAQVCMFKTTSGRSIPGRRGKQPLNRAARNAFACQRSKACVPGPGRSCNTAPALPASAKPPRAMLMHAMAGQEGVQVYTSQSTGLCTIQRPLACPGSAVGWLMFCSGIFILRWYAMPPSPPACQEHRSSGIQHYFTCKAGDSARCGAGPHGNGDVQECSASMGRPHTQATLFGLFSMQGM